MCLTHVGAWLWLCTLDPPSMPGLLSLAESQQLPQPPLCPGIRASTQQLRAIVQFLLEQIPYQEAQHLPGLALGLLAHVCLPCNLLPVLPQQNLLLLAGTVSPQAQPRR